MKLSIAEVRRRLPVGKFFTGEYIGRNGLVCKPENKILRRQVTGQTMREMKCCLLEGSKMATYTYLDWSGTLAREEGEAIILTCTGEDFFKITNIGDDR